MVYRYVMYKLDVRVTKVCRAEVAQDCKAKRIN